MAEPTYKFTRGERGVFAEVYFPKKVEFQGTIFNALKEGYNEETVKGKLKQAAEALLTELADYPANLFDPYRYGTVTKQKKSESPIEQANKRIFMYRSPFKGWSMYEVDGMFFNRRGQVYEERTQVIRLMFRFRSTKSRLVRKRKFEDVLRAILYFVIGMRGHIAGETMWDEASRERFIAMHEPWLDSQKKKFAEKHFTPIAQEAMKWVDDCALFIFGYLVKEFSREVLKTKQLEEEIWVTSFFDATLNVIQRSKQNTITIERENI